MRGVGNKLGGDAKQAASNGMTAGKEAAGRAANAVGGAWNNAKSAVGGAWNNAKSAAGGAWNGAKQYGQGLMSAGRQASAQGDVNSAIKTIQNLQQQGLINPKVATMCINSMKKAMTTKQF